MDDVVLIVNYEHLHYNNLVFHFKLFLFITLNKQQVFICWVIFISNFIDPQPVFTCSQSTMEKPEQCGKSVNS